MSLTALDYKDPQAEQRAQIADAFERHYSRVPERCVVIAFRLANDCSGPGSNVHSAAAPLEVDPAAQQALSRFLAQGKRSDPSAHGR